MNANVWAYRKTSGWRPGIDLTGFTVEATEGPVGKVDANSHEVGSSYLVVDTGVWIFGKEILLPVRAITKVDEESRKIYVDLTKSELKNAPEFDRERHLGHADYRSALSTYYGFGASVGRRTA
ncbi:PRC-barrel domain-containing protein [Streptomyces sp. NPDC029003]|uniref:PRC-barrel domain-containing protein n=1 Tax=Streptomyces sp. NPDC029003 TaxID=3155125 RepID=UPI0033F2F688